MADEGRRWRWTKTAAVLLAITNAGMNLGVLSPTFPDMAVLMSCSLGQMATTMTWVGLGSIVGSVAMGPLFDRFNSFLLLSSALLLQGLAMALAPWCPSLIVYQLTVAVASIFFIGIMTGCMTANCIIWKEKAKVLRPIVQVTGLFHSFGIAVTPQLIEPFLVGKRDSAHINVTPATYTRPRDLDVTATSYPLELATGNSSSSSSPGSLLGPERAPLAYVLMAGLDVFVASVCLSVFAFDRLRQKEKEKEEEKEKGEEEEEEEEKEEEEEEDSLESSRIHRSHSLNAADGLRRIFAEDEFRDAHTERHRTSTLVRTVPERSTDDDDEYSPDKNSTKHDDLQIGRLFEKRRQLQRRKEERRISKECGAIEAAAATGPQEDGVHGGGSQEDGAPPLPEVSFGGGRRAIVLFVIVVVFLSISGGRDALFTGLLFTFLNGFMGWTTNAGTKMVTFYHFARVVTHAVFVLLSKSVSPAILTAANHVIFLASSLLMLFTLDLSPAFTAAAIVLTAVGASNLQTTAVTLAQCSFQVDGKVMGVLIGAVFFGASVASAIAGPLLDVYGPICFPLILLSVTIGDFVLFGLWLIVARAIKSKAVYRETLIADDKTPLLLRISSSRV